MSTKMGKIVNISTTESNGKIFLHALDDNGKIWVKEKDNGNWMVEETNQNNNNRTGLVEG